MFQTIEANEWPRVALLVLSCALATAWPLRSRAVSQVVKPAPAKGIAEDAARLLERTYAFLGGKDRLNRVSALEMQRNGYETIRLLLPDRYQIDRRGLLTTFDGRRLWAKYPPQFPAPPSSKSGVETDADTRRRSLRIAAEYALKYLVRSVPTYPFRATALRHGTLGTVRGVVVEFSAGDGRAPIVMVFEPQTGQPLAVAISTASVPGGPKTDELISELRDYRDVDGIRFPHHITDIRTELDGSTRKMADWRYDFFRVNPSSVNAKTFVQPPQ